MESLNKKQFEDAEKSHEKGVERLTAENMANYADKRLEELEEVEDTPIELIYLMSDISEVSNGILVFEEIIKDEKSAPEIKSKLSGFRDSLENKLVDLEESFPDEYKKYVEREKVLKKLDHN